jgi:hypothetical protein
MLATRRVYMDADVGSDQASTVFGSDMDAAPATTHAVSPEVARQEAAEVLCCFSSCDIGKHTEAPKVDNQAGRPLVEQPGRLERTAAVVEAKHARWQEV